MAKGRNGRIREYTQLVGNEYDREERLRERAYQIWEREGRKHGDHERHWEEAEAELGKEESGTDSSGRSSGPSDGRETTEA
ncbi:DUF2934 domain-containing protein [Ensifer sp. LCM 4579]|uniref:DUF2934 domain-containing protein n=1 Tax=Ensifer sp. LCM 4579 TaxID=1848292 RepID=UPI0009F365D9|nr:DUF2934 domain-containing protein [Ensifer sp. LCM 4579]